MKIQNKIFAFCLLFMAAQVSGSESYYPTVEEAMDYAKKAIVEAANEAYQQVYDLLTKKIEPTRPVWDVPPARASQARSIRQPTRFNRVPQVSYVAAPQAQYATQTPAPQQYAPPPIQRPQPQPVMYQVPYAFAPGTEFIGRDGGVWKVVGAPVAMRGGRPAPESPQAIPPQVPTQAPQSPSTYKADVAGFNAMTNRLREGLIVAPKASTQTSTYQENVAGFNAMTNRLRKEFAASPQTPTEKIRSFYKNNPITNEEMEAFLAQNQDENPQSPSAYDAETAALQARVDRLREESPQLPYGLVESHSVYAPSSIWSSEETIVNPQSPRSTAPSPTSRILPTTLRRSDSAGSIYAAADPDSSPSTVFVRSPIHRELPYPIYAPALKK